MKFNTVQEAFNHYRNQSIEQIEQRAAQLKGTIDTDPNADIQTINIEIEGLNQAKSNVAEKQTVPAEERSYNPITGAQFVESKKVPTEDIFGSKEYRSAFFKQMLGQNLNDLEQRTFNKAMEMQDTERRTDAFNTTTNSAAVLPTQTLNEVISKAKVIGGLITHVRNFNLPTKVRVPIATPATKAAWHTEGERVDSEKKDVTYVQFDGYEIVKVFSMSAAAKKMSIQAFESYITEELTNAVMETIADALVNGTGTDQGTGLDTGITWDESNKIDLTGAYTDFTTALAKLPRGYAAGAKFAMSNSTLYNNVYALVDGNKRPIFIQDPKNETVGHILGKEVVIDDNIEDGTIILGDLKYMGYNMPEGLMLEVSRESSFRSGLVDYRAMAIADTKPLVPEAFLKLTAATPEG